MTGIQGCQPANRYEQEKAVFIHLFVDFFFSIQKWGSEAAKNATVLSCDQKMKKLNKVLFYTKKYILKMYLYFKLIK